METARAYLAPLWTSHADGSLRNGGVEFVTNGGLGGQSLFSAFERICHLLANVIEYQDTFRCSTHMHVNMLDFTVHQVAKFLMVYSACEPYLFAHCGQYRRSSNFCVPVGDSLPFHKNLIANLYEDACATRSGTRVTNKYTAMNLQPLFGSDRVRPIGTVEFRGGRPMTTIEDFLLQANLLLSIKEFVRNGPEDAEELLHLMGDTVTNSVYANGVAAGLTVPQVDLEQATIDAWMLLKAYQQGMKRPRAKKMPYDPDMGALSAHTLPSEGFTWGQAQENSIPTLPSDLSFWNSAVLGLPGSRFSGNRGSTDYRNIGNPYGSIWRKYNMHGPELGVIPGTRGFRDRIVSILSDPSMGGNAMGVEEAYAVAIAWQLRDLENHPLHAIRRAMIDRVERGKRQGLLDNIPFDQQPGIKLEDASLGGFQWNQIVNPVAMQHIGHEWNAMYSWVDPEDDEERTAVNCWSVFQKMLCKVRVKHSAELAAALQTKMDWLPMMKREMYATEMFHLLRITQLPARNHIHREDLPLFDKVCTTMQLLYAHGAAVPVMCYQRRSALGSAGMRYHIRCGRSATTPIGLPVNVLTNEERQVREVNQIGGINVYLY